MVNNIASSRLPPVRKMIAGLTLMIILSSCG